MVPPLSSSTTIRPPASFPMSCRSTVTSPEKDGAAADPSPNRGSEGQGTLPSNDPKAIAAQDSKDSLCVFILDSGAAMHATGDRRLLSDLRAPQGGCFDRFPRRDGSYLPVLAVGSINTPRFAVPDVHHVPDLGSGSTLISVRQLARRGLAVTFRDDSCDVKDRTTGAVVGEGRLRDEDGFYHLEFLGIPVT